MASIELHDLTKYYKQAATTVKAVDGINLEIEAGEFVSIVGRSGSGKTTTLDLLGLLLRPSAGQIMLDGMDTGKLRDGARADLRGKKIGFVFQDFNLLPGLNAIENVMLPLRYHKNGKDGKARKQPARKPAHEPRRPAQKKREIIVERKALVHALIILDRGFAETLAKFFQNYPDQLDAFFADLTIFLDDGNDDPDASAAAMKAKFAEADAAAAGDPTDPGPTPESLRRGEP